MSKVPLFLKSCVFVAGLLISLTAYSQLTVYGGVGRGDATNPGALVSLNPTDATPTIIGDPVTPGGITGLALDASNTLYASSIDGPLGNRTSRLIIISAIDGSLISDIGPITDGGTPVSIGDITFQPGTNVLYGIHSNADATAIPGGVLYTINVTTGVATPVGDTGLGVGGGLAFAPSGTLYAMDSGTPGTLNTINPANAAVISSVSVPFYFDGLGADPVSGTLWASRAGAGGAGGDIYTINPGSGASTLVGSPGLRISDIVVTGSPIVPVPTLSEWGLIFLVLVTLTIGVLFITVRKAQVEGPGGVQMNLGNAFSNLPFDKAKYGRLLLVTVATVALGFAIAVSFFGYQLTGFDIPGALICTPVLTYLIFLVWKR